MAKGAFKRARKPVTVKLSGVLHLHRVLHDLGHGASLQDHLLANEASVTLPPETVNGLKSLLVENGWDKLHPDVASAVNCDGTDPFECSPRKPGSSGT